MMPDLGKYAVAVLLAYGVSGLVLAALVLQSLIRHRSLRKNYLTSKIDSSDLSAGKNWDMFKPSIMVLTTS